MHKYLFSVKISALILGHPIVGIITVISFWGEAVQHGRQQISVERRKWTEGN
jgi:hypothetical protein